MKLVSPRRDLRPLTIWVEAVAVAVVIAAVLAILVWFFFFAHGGSEPGTLF